MSERWIIPEDRKPLTRKQIAAVFLFSIGVYAGMWVCMIFGPWVIWGLNKMRRAWR